MKKIILLTLLTCACYHLHAQVNLVLNPSFEQYSHCPNNLDQVAYANHWNSIDSIWMPGTSPRGESLCLPDYCNKCNDTPTNYVSIPRSNAYYQYPRTGNGMMELRMLIDTIINPGVGDLRDYLQGKLSQPLIGGKKYCVTFYVNLAEYSGYAIDKIGAYLDDGSIDVGQDSADCARAQVRFMPQVYSTLILNDTLNWMKVQGSFIATGTETFITIGNFFSFANTDKIEVAYSSGSEFRLCVYLVDDVSVIASDAVANAGEDKLVSPGSDSAYIGTDDEGMPVTWYLLGNTTPVSYSGGFNVHPDVTTSYVVEMDLCGNVTRDTVTVYVAPAGVEMVDKFQDLKVYPNPASTTISIENAKGGHLLIINEIGQQISSTIIQEEKELQNIQFLPSGIYFLQVINPITGYKIVRAITKQ